jgi:hypothetical protein
MNSQPTVSEIKAVVRKGERDPIWISNIFWRPVSVYVTWGALRLGVSARTVTTISAVCAIAGSLVLLRATPASYVWSAVLIQVFFLLDHVDGEVARFQKSIDSANLRDFSGAFYDRIVHYFQGTSFYFCLAAALWSNDERLVWLLLGVLGVVGSGGFPRFVASYELLGIVLKHRGQETLDFAHESSDYYSVYWSATEIPKQGFFTPRTARQALFVVKQFVGFPGHLFVFATAAVATLLTGSEWWVRGYLIVYAILLGGNTVYATATFLRTLSRVPVSGASSPTGTQ